MERDTILLVDDSEIICSIIKDILESPDLHIEIAHTGEKGIRMARELRPTLILLDIIMYGMDGYETCKILKKDEETKDIPIIFITGNNDSNSLLKGFEVGAADYVSKPFIAEELKARVKVHMQNIKNQRKLQILMEELRELAITDSLTKLYNRRYFLDKINDLVKMDTIFSLILFDVDYFKSINDTYGHNAGDLVLTGLSQIFKLILREEDIISRWGGEEFMICLPNMAVEEAFKVAEKLRLEVSKFEFQYEDNTFHCTITGGIAEYEAKLPVDRNITKIDFALYTGKSSGKNCCILA
ncbi:diguanylate cyclase [Anaerocolumna aminovalerica]|uniref:Stage 0 sporulation protein A homolog n=1 Tax=Anaerocolumna aminovalerica TaxID=1527 RepID=A0A1I5EV21_9FIRM|nr:diguanylate cyclase [Anaerocolumna aminovalerica]SFO15382.1 diguanylate cyclase (GGDEF) domain-containing protein [Anaerocolumna aminovalerica]